MAGKFTATSATMNTVRRPAVAAWRRLNLDRNALAAPARDCSPRPAAAAIIGQQPRRPMSTSSGDPATVPLVQLADASPEVRAIFEDIMVSRNVSDVNNFWKAM